MKYKKMNKKGLGLVTATLIGIVVLLVFMFSIGGVSSIILKNTIENIPMWFWVGLVIFVLIVLGRQKK